MKPAELPIADALPSTTSGKVISRRRRRARRNVIGRDRMERLLHVAAPSTTLRVVPLPRFTVEEPQEPRRPISPAPG